MRSQSYEPYIGVYGHRRYSPGSGAPLLPTAMLMPSQLTRQLQSLGLLLLLLPHALDTRPMIPPLPPMAVVVWVYLPKLVMLKLQHLSSHVCAFFFILVYIWRMHDRPFLSHK